MDYINPKILNGQGVLKGVSSSRRSPTYAIKIEKNSYRVPKVMRPWNSLYKGKTYKFQFLSRSRIILNINQVN